MSDRHPSNSLYRLVTAAIGVFLAHPDGDQDVILSALVREAGIPVEQAWRLYQIVPAATCHVAFSNVGARFPSHYLSVRDVTNIARAERTAWVDDPLYCVASELVDQMLDNGLDEERATAILSHSAEMNVLAQQLDADRDIGDIRFTESVVVEYEALRRELDERRN